MGRCKRIKLASDNAIYHVTTRTAFGAFLFQEKATREWIYQKIVSLSKCFFVDLHAIAVLSNHYHLIFSLRKPTVEEYEVRKRFRRLQNMNIAPRPWVGEVEHWYQKFTDLSEFMKHINQAIALKINKERDNQGHIWGRRFFSSLIENGSGLLACMAYVELNAVRAGICSKPSDYRWCSTGKFSKEGKAASGVTIPKMALFASIKPLQHQSAFTQMVNHLASQHFGNQSSLPKTWSEWEIQLEKPFLEALLVRCFRKTKWAFRSLLIGSANFCSSHVKAFTLPTGRDGPHPYHLFLNLYNEKVRAGEFLN